MKKKVFSLMMMLLLAVTGFVRADELTVHDGTATNAYVPVYGFYADAYLKCEMVYPASELSAMNGGQISSMAFGINSPAAEAWTGTFQVFVKEVSDATISDFSGTTGATTVYTGTLNGTGSTMTVNFTAPYTYNGGNLLVGFYLTTTGNYKSITWAGETVNGASVQGYSYSSLSDITATQRNFLPKTTFTYSGGGGGGGGGSMADNLHIKYVDADGNDVIDELNLGVRPIEAWTEPFEFTMYSEGGSYTINVLDFTPSDGMFTIGGEELPFVVSTTEDVDLNLTTNGTIAGTIERQFVAITEGDRAAHIWPVVVEMYTPEIPDVVEKAHNFGNVNSTFSYVGIPANLTPTTLHDDYTLPFPEIPEGVDGVYKMTFTEDVLLTAYVSAGNDGKVALYTEDFYGEGGPMAHNYYQGPAAAGGGAAGGPFEALIGDPASTTTTGYNPMYYLYNYSLSTALYTAAELAGAGATTSAMNSISWFSNSTYGYNIQNVSIWMANVADTEVTAMSPLGSGMTLVYQGNHQEVVGQNEFVFNQGSFAWDGTSNVLVMVQMNNGSWDSSIQWQSTNPGFAAMSYAYTDNAPYNAQATSYSMYTSSTTRANVLFKSDGSHGRDRAVTELINEGFESGVLPTGWTVEGDGTVEIHTGDYSTTNPIPAATGTYNAWMPHSATGDETFFVTPAMDLSGATSGTVSCNFINRKWGSVDYDEFGIYYRVAGGTWNELYYTSTNHETWTNTGDIALAGFGANYQLGFYMYDGYGYGVAIDDILVTVDGAAVAPEIPEGISYGPIIAHAPVAKGTYYLVASSTTPDFEVTINAEPMPCPAVEGFAFNPQPADNEDAVDPSSVTLRWMIPDYATGWRLIFGSTYHPEVGHPQTIIYPEDGSFSTELANSYTVRNLWNNTNYFWRVEFNNEGACPEGVSSPVWGFTTHLNVPQNLRASDETIFEDETLTLTWDAVVDRTYRMYNVYQDGVCIGHTTMNNIGATTYEVSNLPYNMTGYEFYVTAVYDEGESEPSNSVTVKVSGYSDETGINGYAWEQDGTTGIPGVLVTLTGTDEFGDPHTYTATTDNNGYYNKRVYAGEYTRAVATKDGYQETETVHPMPFTLAYNTHEDDVNFIIDENFDPVCAVIAEYYPDSLDPESPYVKVYWGCGLPGSEIVEDFETGDFSLFDWQVDATYPWSITTTNPYEGTYCMKSGGAGVANVVSNMTVTVNIPADGIMSFFGKISCESSWDYGYFYIDGVQKGSYTGASNWAEKTFDITAGDHTFQWRYTKDGSVNSNDDCFYVDYITFYKQPEPAIPGMTYDFEDSSLQGWTSVDADGDGYGWEIASSVMTGQPGHNSSSDFVISQSYYMGTVLYPDNYLVSPQVQLGGIVRFYACAQDASYAAEHFGVAVSTTNTQPSSFTMLQEWTMSAKSAPVDKKAMFDATADVKGMGHSRNGNNREQGNWYEYTVDLSAYSGMGYVAIRHFNCHDMFYLNVDDITISEPGKGVAQTRSLNHYRVYRTNCYNDGPYTEENTVLLATVWVPDTVYIDVEWADLPAGVYKWGVGAVYAGNRGEMIEGPISWTAPQAVNMNRASGSFAAKNGTAAGSHTGNAGVTNRDGWLIYDDGINEDAIGLTAGGSFYWGVMFPGGSYTGNQLTKVSMYDYSAHTGNILVYQGGDTAPGTLVGTQAYTCTGSGDFAEWTMSTPVTIDPSQNLWIVMNNNDGQYVASIAAYCGDDNSQWISMDGTSWDGLYNATGGSIDGTWMIRAYTETSGAPSPEPGTTNNLNHLALPRESETIWSNCLDKDMYLTADQVTVNVLLNSADSPEGVNVTFTNYNEYEQQTYGGYEITLDETGFYAFESFRKGEYNVKVEFDGYEPIEDSVSIWDPMDLRYVMIEIIYGVDNLYVSSTGWAMWDAQGMPSGGGGGGTSGGDTFTDDFESGLSNWTLVDADADGQNWYHSSQSMTYSCYDYTGWGNNSSDGFAISQSYTDCTYDTYDPNNFMITNQKYSISASSVFSFYADYGNDSYPDHFGVAVATVDNPTPADFTMVWEGTAKSGNAGKAQVRHDSDRYQNWRHHNVDLSAYAGQDVYIAFRHFNSYDQYELYIDDVELTSGSKAGDRHLEYFKVMCESLDHEPIFNADVPADQPFCQVATEELVPGEHYIAKVAAMYSTGMSAWTECEWQYIPCTEYAGTVDGVTVNGNEISWTYPGGEPLPPTPPTPGDDVTVKLTAGDVWGDGSGYQMLLDADHNAFGTTIPETGALSTNCSGNEAIYAEFEYKIPADADGNCSTTHMVMNNTVTITIPAGTYDWCITNPTPGDRIWIAAANGNVGGRQNDYVFEGGKTYEFTVSMYGTNDGVDVTISGGAKNTYAPLACGEVKDIANVVPVGQRAAWDLMFTFTAPEAAQYGVVTDGNNFYTSNWGYSSATHNFYKYDMQGNMLEGFEIPGCGTLRGMTYDGEHFYGVANSSTVYCVDLANHSVVNTFTSSYGAMRGITYDPERDGFWVIGNWSGNLTLIDRMGAIVQTGPEPTSASDLAYYKDENNVEHVYCFDNGTNYVWDYNIANNTIGGYVFDFSNVPGFAAGSSGGCHVGSVDGKIAFIGDIQQDPNLIGVYELRDDNVGPVPPVPAGDIIGAMIFVDGEWVAQVDYPTNTYTYEGEGEEVCVRLIYNGTNNLPEGNIYYSMSCPECEPLEPGIATCEPGAPIHAELMPGNDDIKVWWGNAPAAPVSDWLYYDDGTNEDAIGLQGGGSFYWGIKFPAAAMSQYAGCSVTKIGYFDYTAHTGTVRIYNGSNGDAPGTLIGTYNYTAAGTEDWVEWTIPAVAFDNTQDLWIVMNNTDGGYVASVGPYTGDPNGTLISIDGSTWYTLNDATGGELDGTWNLRCYVTNQAKGGEIVALDDELNGTPGGVIGNAGVSKQANAPVYMNRAELVKYNVYRSTEANGTYTLIAEVAETGADYYEYIDTPGAAGTYYYQVRAMYSDDCESEPAQAADDPSVNYVFATTDGVGENGGNVALYPNPTKGNVTIEAEGMSRITVVSVLGQVVFDTELDADTYTLNMSQFNAGMYMVRVYTEEGVTVKRVTVMQ